MNTPPQEHDNSSARYVDLYERESGTMSGIIIVVGRNTAPTISGATETDILYLRTISMRKSSER